MILFQKQDALRTAKKADDMMGFGNGVSAPTKAIDTTDSEPATASLGTRLTLSVASEETKEKPSLSEIEQKECEFKKRELRYERQKLLTV